MGLEVFKPRGLGEFRWAHRKFSAGASVLGEYPLNFSEAKGYFFLHGKSHLWD
jgi:hypothetical protein